MGSSALRNSPAPSGWSPSTAPDSATNTPATKRGCLAAVDNLVALGVDTLERRRAFVTEQLRNGLYPYTRRWLPSLDNHFSTIGVNGCNEMVRNFTHDAYDITGPPGAKPSPPRLLDHINNLIVARRNNRTPVQPGGHPGGRHHLPVRQGRPQTIPRHHPRRIRAGTLLHQLFPTAGRPHPRPLRRPRTPGRAAKQIHRWHGPPPVHGVAMSDGKACAKLVRRALENFHLPYITITPTFSICPEHGYISGEHPHCPHCDQTPKCGLGSWATSGRSKASISGKRRIP